MDPVVVTAVKGSVDHRRADSLLRMWWAELHRWALDKPKVSPDDEMLLHDTLHHLATHGPPDQASSPQLGDGHTVTIELAGKGRGPAGLVQVPDDLWAQWADPQFRQAGETAPAARESSCPKVAALLRKLHANGFVDKSLLSPNARAFVKYKSLAKCALIIDMQAFNHACSFKARPFRLPSLEGLAVLLRLVQDEAWGAKVDLSNYYWSVHLPPAMAGAVRVAAAGTTYSVVSVPFGWHQAPGLLQHLIGAVLSELPDTQVVTV